MSPAGKLAGDYVPSGEGIMSPARTPAGDCVPGDLMGTRLASEVVGWSIAKISGGPIHSERGWGSCRHHGGKGLRERWLCSRRVGGAGLTEGGGVV